MRLFVFLAELFSICFKKDGFFKKSAVINEKFDLII